MKFFIMEATFNFCVVAPHSSRISPLTMIMTAAEPMDSEYCLARVSASADHPRASGVVTLVHVFPGYCGVAARAEGAAISTMMKNSIRNIGCDGVRLGMITRPFLCNVWMTKSHRTLSR